MKKISLPTSQNKSGESNYMVTKNRYQQQIKQGLTDDEILKPGTYKAIRGGFLQRHPELKSPQKPSKVRVTMFLDQDIVDSFKRAAEAENAMPYQTQINLALRNHLEAEAPAVSLGDGKTIKALAKAIANELKKAA